MTEELRQNGDVAVLVVHGIGRQERGEALCKLLTGLQRLQPDSVRTDSQGRVRATIGGQPARFYEVYWADLLMGDDTFGAFEMNEVRSFAWFPLFNLWRGSYEHETYSRIRLVFWCLVLPLITLLLAVAHAGLSFVAQLVEAFKGRRHRKKLDLDDAGTLGAVMRKLAGRSSRYTEVDQILDEYAGDVFAYVNSAARAFHREKGERPKFVREDVFERIVGRFNEQLLHAQANGCAAIQVVAHSLGTVVTYHALSGLRCDSARGRDAEAIEAALAKVSHLYTIGSPLEKIRFFWPRLRSGEAPPAWELVEWDNFVSFFDPVAGRLRRFGAAEKVDNHYLLGGGFISAHTVYERSQAFLSTLGRGISGREIRLQRTPWERLKDVGLLALETMAAPTALLGVLVLGIVVSLLGLGGATWIVYQGLERIPQLHALGSPGNLATVVVVGFALLHATQRSIRRASRVHKRYWAGESHRETEGPEAAES